MKDETSSSRFTRSSKSSKKTWTINYTIHPFLLSCTKKRRFFPEERDPGQQSCSRLVSWRPSVSKTENHWMFLRRNFRCLALRLSWPLHSRVIRTVPRTSDVYSFWDTPCSSDLNSLSRTRNLRLIQLSEVVNDRHTVTRLMNWRELESKE